MLIDQRISEYLKEHITRFDRFGEVEKYSREHNIPVIQPDSAAFLSALVTVRRPESILEIGTASGLSGLIMLQSSDARLITIERDKMLHEFAIKNFDSFGYLGRVTALHCDADEVVANLSGKFDFIFLDANKSRYHYYLPHLADALSDNGVILSDNVLFGGRTCIEESQIRKSITITRGLGSFLDKLKSDTRFVTSIVPIGDGISLSVKK